MVRTIKRYSNRKLYDTTDSRYVTLQQIAGLIRNGDEIRVVDKTTQQDLTAATMAQIIFEEEKRGPRLADRGFAKDHSQRSAVAVGRPDFSRSADPPQCCAGRTGISAFARQ